MTDILVRHRVEQYDRWKKVFDEFIDTRKSSGEKSFRILRPEDDPDNLYLFFQWDTAERAKEFFKSSVLEKTMQNAGVAEVPEIHFLNQVAQGTL
jgi:heme-degrading monooxygenase HmoA